MTKQEVKKYIEDRLDELVNEATDIRDEPEYIANQARQDELINLYNLLF